jgi:hypothetical protein
MDMSELRCREGHRSCSLIKAGDEARKTEIGKMATRDLRPKTADPGHETGNIAPAIPLSAGA